LRIAWVILAEGIGSDAKHAFTAIGVNQNVLVTPKFPATTKRAVIAHFEDVELTSGDSVQVSFSVIAPSGRVLVAQTGTVTATDPPWPELPRVFDVPAEFAISVSEYGTHILRAEAVPPDGEVLTGEVALYVMKPPVLP
jgi:hypothetical protein